MGSDTARVEDDQRVETPGDNTPRHRWGYDDGLALIERLPNQLPRYIKQHYRQPAALRRKRPLPDTVGCGDGNPGIQRDTGAESDFQHSVPQLAERVGRGFGEGLGVEATLDEDQEEDGDSEETESVHGFRIAARGGGIFLPGRVTGRGIRVCKTGREHRPGW